MQRVTASPSVTIFMTKRFILVEPSREAEWFYSMDLGKSAGKGASQSFRLCRQPD